MDDYKIKKPKIIDLSIADSLPDDDLLKEILLGLVPEIAGVNLDEDAKPQVLRHLSDLFRRYSIQCRIAIKRGGKRGPSGPRSRLQPHG
jgi:hypothetical protein